MGKDIFLGEDIVRGEDFVCGEDIVLGDDIISVSPLCEIYFSNISFYTGSKKE